MKTTTTLYASFEELCLCTSIDEQRIVELIEQEVIIPESGEGPEEWQFGVTAISTIQKAARLQTELLVDWADIPLVLSLLEEIDQLRADNERLVQRLSRFLDETSDRD